ncbi:MAG: bifunctional 2-polyprenyl-6-hydroxyphenol methylase/3-demethylubiquinol 3-O-methyltransferase UbiG [Rickettsiales bacterium]|nr:bifunctional 2-polyprenyl-6-hydroxyphenol methylase/3-demethylubiquinol 3-O-methyltransferase UbiG [Rickettsiales bacterium]
MVSTIDEAEVKKFSDIADEWWSETGKFKPLHKFNPIRISYIRQKIVAHFLRDEKSTTALNGLKIIDIGCGGGLISEPFARMGADVTAIDASEKNIAVAKIHAEKSGLKIDYRAAEANQINEKFDVVFALEIIEHVADVAQFVEDCASLLKDDGILFIATLNRTVKSFALAKVGAEYILRWLPIGTHDWKKFLKPSEIANFANGCGLDLQGLSGFSYNILKDEWKIDAKDLDVNYIATFLKK